MSRNDEELPISDDDARFVERLDALYQPPEPSAAARARFRAGLEERIDRGSVRRPPLWVGGAVAASALALVLALLPAREGDERAASGADQAATELPSAAESLLLLANGPLADPDEALPEDYQTLASLLE
jgi:hypothetical protein